MQQDPSDNRPLVSVIILTWNALSLLQEYLPSVVASSYDNLEIILADNASSDGSADWVSQSFPEVRIVRHQENYGFCRGNNLAIAKAHGDYVVLLNNDVEVDRDWLQPLVAQMMSDDTVAAVQPKILKSGEPLLFEYAGAAGGFIDRWGFPFARGRLFETIEKDEGQYDVAADIFWATGAAVMLRATVLKDVGLLDEQFFMHMEEIDLCWRMKRRGYRIVCEPASAVYHLGGGSLPGSSSRKAYYNFRNNLLTLYKNLSPSDWRRVIIARILLDAVAAMRAVALGRANEARAIWRAHRDAAKMRERYTADRPAAESGVEVYGGSIVIDYFFRGRRTFMDLPSSRFSATR
jgi:GT2 family glycosyltransferase